MTASSDRVPPLVCSFRSSSTSGCGLIDYKKTWPKKILPLTCCQNSVDSHLQNLAINRRSIENECALIKMRAGLFNEDDETLTICPKHRYILGVGWRSSKMCSLGWKCAQKSRSNSKGTITKEQSFFLKKHHDVLIQIGSGVCTNCRKELVQKMVTASTEMEQEESTKCNENHDDNELQCELPNDHEVQADPMDMEQIKENHDDNELQCELPNDHEVQADPMHMEQKEVESTTDDIFSQPTPFGSQLSSEWQDSQEHEDSPLRKRKALNTFLDAIGVSPIKKTLTVDFESASKRTQNDYLKKSKDIIHNIISIIAPNQEALLQKALYSSNPDSEDTSIMESISKAYSSMTSWGTQRQLLSLLVEDHSYNEIKEYIPSLSKYKYTAARKHAAINGIGMPIENKSQTREKATKEQIEHFLEFIMSPAIMTDSPFGTCSYKISSGITLNVPKIILNSVRTRTVSLYMKFCEEVEFRNVLSERSYMRILEAVEPGIRKSMRGLDNFAADGSQAFDDLKNVVRVLGQLGKGHEWSEKMTGMLNEGKQYLKVQYKLHISENSEIPDHCCTYALSSEDTAYSKACDHSHQKVCDECNGITSLLDELQEAISCHEVNFTDHDQKDDIQYTVAESVKLIKEWKMHIIRTVNQDRARTNILENMKSDEALLERDWAMKFLPLQYRESQAKWFAKRGLSWHISVLTWKEEALRSATFVHVFDIANQDAITSAAILQDTLSRIKNLNAAIQNVYVRSDNAGCYHSVYGIGVVPCINQISRNDMNIKRMDFCDPQGGKSICDRKAAHIKWYIKRFVNEGNNVLNASDFKAALENKMNNVQVIVSLPPISKPPKVLLKLQNISQLFDFSYDNRSLTAWKQYEIGRGKTINYDTAGINLNCVIPEITPRSVSKVTLTSPPMETQTNLDSSSPTCQGQDATASSSIDVSNQEMVESTCADDCSNVFTCPEDGCISTFLRYGHLCNHLDTGNHTFSVERMDLKDRSRFSYAILIENRLTGPNLNGSKDASSGVSTLERGWALKKKREVKRFTETQKSFMTKKFNQGESTGFKCEPEEVAREMRSVKNENGERIFHSVDFLSASQIASFFSRLSLKKRQMSNTDYEENDLTAEGNMNNLNQISDVALKAVN